MNRDSFIKFATFALLAGRGYQHVFWDGPYRALFWDEALWSPILDVFNISWETLFSSTVLDFGINILSTLIGIVLLIAAISITNIFGKKVSSILLKTSSIFIGVVALLVFKESHFQLPMLIEHALQISLPWILAVSYKHERGLEAYQFHFRFLIALTFIGHGTYALGLGVPVPGMFLDMTIEILRVSENQARTFLAFAGVWDYLIGLLIFFPITLKGALIFASFWGTVTAFARVVSYVSLASFLPDMHGWWFETAYRLCHGLVPLFVLLVILKKVIPTRHLDKVNWSGESPMRG